MARAPNEKLTEAKKLFLSGMKLIEIAKKLDLPAGTIRRWKSTYKWDSERSVDKGERSKGESERSDKKKKKSEQKKGIAKEVEQVIDNSELTDKQRLFCLYYIKSFNATKSYQRAYGCKYTVANAEGYKLLVKPCVKEMIYQLKQGKLNKAMLEPEDIFQKYMDIAFADITEYLSFGQKEVNYIDKAGNERTALVSFVDLNDSKDVDGTILSEVSQGKDGVKIKLADRMKALNFLTDHMDLATEKQKAELAVLKSRIQEEDEIQEDDGFLEALSGTAQSDWSDDDEDEEE